MAQITLRRGKAADLANQPIADGTLSFTTDDGRVHIDYMDTDGTVKRKTLYEGKLTIGPHVYDGTNDVNVNVYDGTIKEG